MSRTVLRMGNRLDARTKPVPSDKPAGKKGINRTKDAMVTFGEIIQANNLIGPVEVV